MDMSTHSSSTPDPSEALKKFNELFASGFTRLESLLAKLVLMNLMNPIRSKNQSYGETVCTLRLYMKWLFIPEFEYVCPSCQDNPWTFRKWISPRTCPRGVTLETDQTSLEAGVGINLLQSVVPLEERTNQINDNYFWINLLFQLSAL